MSKFMTIIMYILWIVSLIGILVITFTGFKYTDLNLIVAVIFSLTVINSFFTSKNK